MITLKIVQCHPGVTYFIICDIRELWHSVLSTRVPECHKLKMYVKPRWQSVDKVDTSAV